MSQPSPARVLSANEVATLLLDQEEGVLAAVRDAYLAHGRGQTSLPHSVFLRFPDSPSDRIISLPAYLGGEQPVAGMKWVASFPANVEHDLPRASAVMVLNSCQTGYPQAVLEASQISAQRTAASAALAASLLLAEGVDGCAMIGAGPISFEIARFLRVVFPRLSRFEVYDLLAARAESFAGRLRSELNATEARVVSSLAECLASHRLVSFATTAIEPHVDDLSMCPAKAVILHVSLRDLAPQLILAANNVVDDRDHVCRAQTSIHLAAEAVGHRDFIWCSLDELIEGAAKPAPLPGAPTIFSPFGLGILDLAVAQHVLASASERRVGVEVDLAPPGAESERST